MIEQLDPALTDPKAWILLIGAVILGGIDAAFEHFGSDQ